MQWESLKCHNVAFFILQHIIVSLSRNCTTTEADVSCALPRLSLLNETQIELLSPVGLTLSKATASCEVRGFISLLTTPCDAT
jgi:hypothetical protein